MKHLRSHSSKGASLSLLWPAIVGGGALLWLTPLACSLTTEGNHVSGGSGGGASASSSAASTTGSSAGGGGIGGAAASTASVGGTGGEGVGGAGVGGAGVGGAGGMGGGPIVYSWTATDPGVPAGACAATYTYDLPPWLTFSSPTQTERTSQVAVDKLCRDYTQHVPRARNVGKGWGLNIESTRKNLVKESESWTGATWGAGEMTPVKNLTDPSGGDKATEFTSAGDQGANYPFPAVMGQVGSTWARGSGGVAPYAHFRHVKESTFWVDVDSDQWTRYSVAQKTNLAGDLNLETKNAPAGAGVITGMTKIQAFGAQIEADAFYPSSYIPTAAGTVTRDKETLSSVNGLVSELAPGGYFNITLKFAPNFSLSGALNEMTAGEYNLIFFEPKNRLFLRKGDRKMVLRIDNNEAVSDPLTFSREQELTVVITNQASKGFQLSVSGATDGDGDKSGSPEKEVNTGGSATVYILGDDKGAEECSDLRYILFDKPIMP